MASSPATESYGSIGISIPKPVARISVQGFVFADSKRVSGATVKVEFNGTIIVRMKSREDGLFFFDNVPLGAKLIAEHPGKVFDPVMVDAEPRNYFIYGSGVPPP